MHKKEKLGLILIFTGILMTLASLEGFLSFFTTGGLAMMMEHSELEYMFLLLIVIFIAGIIIFIIGNVLFYRARENNTEPTKSKEESEDVVLYRGEDTGLKETVEETEKSKTSDICPVCGSLVNPTDDFCVNCGEKIERD